MKKIKGHLKDWALDKKGWHKLNSKELINLNDIDNSSSNEEIYYKERWINENDLSQRLIVSYSPKYAAYQKGLRTTQIERAQKLINNPLFNQKKSYLTKNYKNFKESEMLNETKSMNFHEENENFHNCKRIHL